ncbi:ATP-binding protein [Niallia sp. NCCP-28]|uniref:ATP-binding protein n=1 Tax=Niallia sp. NCCP-28 TaxID=2934712 RepID=UPI002852CF7F|nr:ATP-binding protein [Niallia sp. NCCP-28]
MLFLTKYICIDFAFYTFYSFSFYTSAETAEELPRLLREAEQVSWTYLELLEAITHFELNKRKEKSIERRMKWARFPYHKTFVTAKVKLTLTIT